MTALLALVAVAGLGVGSVLTVVVHRVPRAEPLLRPGFHCPQCMEPIRARHSVPVLGWVLLRGRCVHCGQRISPRYPLVEAGTAVLFVAVAARFGFTLALPAYLYLAAVAVALALIDIDVKRLPDAIVLPSYLAGALLLAPAALVHGDGAAAVRGLVAMAALWACYCALAVAYPGGMGFGDVKLAGLLGLYLGWLGWSSVWIGTLAGFLLGGLAGAVLLATRRATRRTHLPFGPYMLAGALVAVFLAGPVGAWYASLIATPAPAGP